MTAAELVRRACAAADGEADGEVGSEAGGAAEEAGSAPLSKAVREHFGDKAGGPSAVLLAIVATRRLRVLAATRQVGCEGELYFILPADDDTDTAAAAAAAAAADDEREVARAVEALLAATLEGAAAGEPAPELERAPEPAQVEAEPEPEVEVEVKKKASTKKPPRRTEPSAQRFAGFPNLSATCARRPPPAQAPRQDKGDHCHA